MGIILSPLVFSVLTEKITIYYSQISWRYVVFESERKYNFKCLSVISHILWGFPFDVNIKYGLEHIFVYRTSCTSNWKRPVAI